MAFQELEVLPPPTQRYTVLGWFKKNLFSSVFDTLLTILGFVLLISIINPILNWVFTTARWEVVAANLRLIMVGRYPADQIWRILTCIAFLGFLIGLSWGAWIRAKRAEVFAAFGFPFLLALLPLGIDTRLWWVGIGAVSLAGFFFGRKFPIPVRKIAIYLWVLFVPVFIIIIRGFANNPILPSVDTTYWGGLLLTFILSGVGISLSFPIGVACALGRRSKSPIIHSFCVLYIELVRSVPLVTVLFTTQLVLPLFLPPSIIIDQLSRALVAITLFSGAYMAEIIRGGLQAIPRGQYEAAEALGLNNYQSHRLIILPQALRIVLPVIVNHAISMFRDTSLVIIVGLLDLLGIAKTILAQPAYLGTYVEVFSFIAALYWAFCYVMAYIGRRIEGKTDAAQKR